MTKASKPKPLLQDAEKPVRSRPRKARDPAQPNLPFDPMPDGIEPCLALLRARPPKGDGWVYEIKWDGYRLSVHVEPTRIRILTRGGHDWTDRFPAIKQAALWLPVGTAILDGEAVVLDQQGRSDFGLLQQSLGGRGGKKSSSDAIFMAFDLLYFDGHDLRNSELDMRRHLLEDLVPAGEQGDIRLSEEIEVDGDQLLASACEHGLEGIIAKRRDAPYRSGRLGDWLKIKCTQSDGFAIVGYEKSSASFGGIGRLLLAARKGDEFVYVGGVGTGFNERSAAELREQMDKLIISKPAVDTGRKRNAVFIDPKLVAEIEYRAWTHDGKLRNASYKGLRDAADVATVYELA
ncbi:non-homologous end-joining DNA ligase [Rhizobium leguminosarum]|uniref:non-homologous end-joining DNA ligase n=1 Tax=Rhizobium leguminosarum TaxID=384 RepID=UPI00098FA909|nr:non-homologous end-joining DNA ligase [Rhizobium leguminosarum]MBY5328504.1 ATP-dependent DNA ligase [Rhizobium leguminosarum]MDX6000571.1 non-homologous end-joining DNA ligase [Rhizobium leguminosarum]OOO44743.1 ATP-dependent DNA ligase [Rhizobium leguminosarum bv. viciae USDA 2370]PUB64916.1 ATP-dependent DNA ligase [Rhizobium leguminosarum bv. viciae USDA 2370]TBZ72459.1 ATP-dependent DNA ligase [Rhizobium leguminosarum bv. viciae]